MPQCCGNTKIHVEVPFLLLGFTLMFENSVTTNFLLYRTCYVSLGYSKTDCSLLGTQNASNYTIELETKVQSYATRFIIMRSLIEAFVPPIFSFFLASWSDKNGRKPLMLLSIGGMLMGYVLLTIVSSLPNMSPWFILLFEIPFCIGGSFITLMTACLSYISDVTLEENKAMRLGFLDASLTVGTLIGTLTSSFVFNAFGYPTIYLTCVGALFCAWIFTLFFIPESLQSQEIEESTQSFFTLSPIIETVQIIFKKRPRNDRALILCLFSVFIAFIASRFADSNVIYLYLRKNFHFTLEKFTLLLAFSQATWAICCLVSVYVLVKLFHVKETIIMLVGLLCSIAGSILLGFADNNFQLYVSASVKSLGSFVAPMAQTLLTRVAPKDEIGKVFGVLVSVQSVALLLSSTFNTFVYNKTILTVPQTFSFVQAVLYFVTFILTIAVTVILRRRHSVTYNLLINDTDAEE